jgi:hypothetical protein
MLPVTSTPQLPLIVKVYSVSVILDEACGKQCRSSPNPIDIAPLA